MDSLYLDDPTVGQRFASATYTVDAAEIQRFAAEYDPQPFHMDETAARETLFGGLVASGWHTAGMMMRLIVGGGLPIAGGIIGSGGELLWTKPVRPGDTLHLEGEVVELIPSKTRPQGIARVKFTTFNQDGEAVYTFTPIAIVPRRPA